ncbi:MAG: M1 family peptidase [Chitinophagaceae bacterium]|nr:M1 family peptidase [Chitinophagaceae bacterium]
MRQWLLLYVLMVSLSVSAQPEPDVIRYRFEISLNDKNDSIRGKARILFTITQADSLLAFDLTGPLPISKKGMKVTNAALSSGSNMIPVTITQESQRVLLHLRKSISSKDTLNLLLSYEGIPNDGLIISKNKFGQRTFFADNWPNRGHNWIPCHDVPWDKAAVEFAVTAPRQYQVVANGVQMEESTLPGNMKYTEWLEEVPVSPKVMVIGVAEFAVQLSGMVNNCMPVYSWVYPQDRDAGFYDYAQAIDILNYYIGAIGPYAYKKLANVESKTIFGGLENANTIFYSESAISGTRENEELIAHEIAHQWFGNMATEKTFAHLWLSEGFATYMTVLYFENKYGVENAKDILRGDRDIVCAYAQQSNRPVVDDNPDYLKLLNPNSYQKGSWVLHMLRQETGDSIFRKGIRQYYATYAGSTASTSDFRKVMETVSGKDLTVFFNQWLERPGVPNLKISWKWDAGKKELQVTVDQLQDKPYVFPLEIGLSGNTSRVETMQVSNKTQTFSFPCEEKPGKLAVDPEVKLLFKSQVTEIR